MKRAAEVRRGRAWMAIPKRAKGTGCPSEGGGATAGDLQLIQEIRTRLCKRVLRSLKLQRRRWVARTVSREGKSCHYKLRASPAKATMELPFARNYPAATSKLLLSPHRLAAVY